MIYTRDICRSSFLLNSKIMDTLTSDDLNEVRRALWDARSKWYDIGVELKLRAGDLEAIKQTYSDVGKCLTEMILKWLRTIEPHPPSWSALCGALKRPTVGHSDIAKQIQECNENSSHRDLALSMPEDENIPAPTHSDTRRGFNCHCGKCNWDDYLQNPNQCQCWIPFLNVRYLDEADREGLEHKLYQDAKRIIRVFSDLYLDTIDSFEERKIDPIKVATSIKSIAPSDILTLNSLERIEDVSSINSVLAPLQHKYITFFDHNILKYIIERHGSEEDKERLGKFLIEFNEYCKRSVFEVPQIIFGQTPRKSKTFIIKIDEKHFSAQFSLHDLKAVQRKLADVLNIYICNLNIRTVARGCIKVIASSPNSIADIVLSQLVSNHKVDCLKAQGIHIMPGPPGKPQALSVSETAITLHWSKPEYGSEDVQRYGVSYKLTNDSKWECVQTKDNSQGFNFEVDHYISDTMKEMSLVFKVNTVNDYGEGMESAESDVIELPHKLSKNAHQFDVKSDSHPAIDPENLSHTSTLSNNTPDSTWSSNSLSTSSYAKCFDYEHQFRVLVMHLVMDYLSLHQIEKYLFVYNLPERLRVNGRERLRTELLTYINEQLLDKWRKMPSALREVLETIGRPDLSTRVQELVDSYPAAIVCQETTSSCPEQEVAGVKLQPEQAPVQETVQQLAQALHPDTHVAEDQLHCDFAGIDRSSTKGDAHLNSQPQAPSIASHNTPQSSRYRKSFKQHGQPLENILEETSLSQDDEKHDLRREGVKCTVSIVSHDSIRSSGYFSNPRASDLRLSQVSTGGSIAENDDDYQEVDATLLEPIKQTRKDSMEDEAISIRHTNEFQVDSGDSSGTESSSPASSLSRDGLAPAVVAEDHDDLPPVRRLRSYQMSTPSHMRRLPIGIDMYDDLSPEHSKMQRRSSSLPTTSRTSYVKVLNASVLMPGIDPQSSLPHSSSTSLKSKTTYGSPSEKSSMTGSKLPIASATSGHIREAVRLGRIVSLPPLPVYNESTFFGSMKIKVKNIIKSIKKNAQSAITSGEFPSIKGHHIPRFEMRFFPSNFGKDNSALYIDVARSHLHKMSKSKQLIMIPAMNITVQVSYGDSKGGACSGHTVKTETLETAVMIYDSQREASKRCVIASFPQLVSHAELGLQDTIIDGQSSLVICVEMSVRSS